MTVDTYYFKIEKSIFLKCINSLKKLYVNRNMFYEK